MSSANSNVVDLVAADSSGTKQSKPSFSHVKWKSVKISDPIVSEFAAIYYKKPIQDLPKSSITRFKAMLCLFTLNQLQLAFGFLGGDSEDLPTTRGVARKAVINLVLAKTYYLTNKSASKTSPTPTAASVNTVVTLSPTKRIKSTTGGTSGVKAM